MSGTSYQLHIIPKIPPQLSRLEELANDLWYSWDRPTRLLFVQLVNRGLWVHSGHSPKAALMRMDQHSLDEAAQDPALLGAMANVLSSFDTYHGSKNTPYEQHLGEHDLVAYFCAEFGFHESLPIYSGGLGILAGDHCKTASDLNLPFVGVGLLYRQGYFLQTIDSQGVQHAEYNDTDFKDLPIKPVLGEDGADLVIDVPFPARVVQAKIWTVRVGHVSLYLLDTALPGNSEHDREITHRLYGGDRSTRIEQEILLGMGGVRALETLGLKPTVWHINEGHAAFLVLERICQLVADGLDFYSALETVAANTVFTTHTVVPAGHDHFSVEVMREYFGERCSELGCSVETLLDLGKDPNSPDFNMTALAIRASRHQNGVSRIHGQISSDVCAYLWPQIGVNENPMRYVTNGVHLPTFLSDYWHEAFKRSLGPDWMQRITEAECWQGVHNIPDHQFWSIRQSVKSSMLHMLNNKINRQGARTNVSQAHLERMLRNASPDNPNVLTIGFARRFATYKRATLLFSNLDILRSIVSDKNRPVVFVFAGKAHPADKPGQEIIRRIAEVANMPEFLGHILLLEGFDLHTSRRLVSGVDVWLNNPVYPLEASGTSGMKAAINGVPNLSVLDGWWGEACDETPEKQNGWGVKPANTSGEVNDPERDGEEAGALYEILQDKLIPLYYDRGPMGYSSGWVAMAKQAIISVAPQFNSNRMLDEYVRHFYAPAAKQWQRFTNNSFQPARELAQWKAKVCRSWPNVGITRIDQADTQVNFGEKLQFTVAVHLDSLTSEDVKVELLFGRPNRHKHSKPPQSFYLDYQEQRQDGASLFGLTMTPEICGKIEYRIRVYPTHELLTHKFEMGMMLWL